MIINQIRKVSWIISTCFFFLISCKPVIDLSQTAKADILENAALRSAHVGISIFDPATNAYLYNFQGDKYFIPASNTKIPTCYAAMKYLGDSLVGMKLMETDTAMYLYPTGDPSFLHTDYNSHPVFDKLKSIYKKLYVIGMNWNDDHWGSGWSWNDFDQGYMAERSPLPVYGNVLHWVQEKEDSTQSAIIYSIPEVDWEINFEAAGRQNFRVERRLSENVFTLIEGREKKRELLVPFVTNGAATAVQLLGDTLQRWIALFPGNKSIPAVTTLIRVHSQPTDSLLKPMMHRSDNFFAEQTLLMVSNEVLGMMNDSRIIDTILSSDFKDLPQRPRWADGSGLSRYNLFTPQDFVAILDKMRKEFGMERIKTIFPTGGEGTISNYYKSDSGYIYGKTGTLSGVVAFSGYMYTKKGKLLIFSTLINNHQASATEIRRAVEKFLRGVRETY